MKKTKIPFANYFYNKLMLLNTGIICVVTLLFGVIASKNAINYERVMMLRSYDDALNQLHANYITKQDNFSNLMLTFYENGDNFQAISTLLDSDSADLSSIDAFELQRITVLFNALCNKDPDILSVFVYKTKTETLYSYSPASRVVKKLSSDSPIYDQLKNRNFSRSIHPAMNISSSESDTPILTYGIGGNLSSASASIQRKPGNIMVAYSFSGLLRALQNKNFRFPGRFYILTLDGKVIFDSEKQIVSSTQGTQFPYVEQLINKQNVITIDGTEYFSSSIIDEKYKYISTYIVPKADVDKYSNYFSLIIFIGSIGFIGISFMAYALASRLSSKRIGMIEHAMHQIGANNLTYRIPPSRNTDEFSFIATRFNEMCDELEDKINKIYIYGLKQKSAELYALQTSINPHFLYNTLEAIRGRLVNDGNLEAAEMIVILSRLYRNQIKGTMFITLREEINQCNMYLELFSIRHYDNFQCNFDIPNYMLKYGIPKNTLQPILENYLVHGMKDEDNLINITGTMNDDIMEIVVQDNGRGIASEQLKEIQRNLQETRETSRTGFGLSNVNERLKIVYGSDFGLSIDSNQNTSGTSVTIRFKAILVEELEAQYHSMKGDE